MTYASPEFSIPPPGPALRERVRMLCSRSGLLSGIIEEAFFEPPEDIDTVPFRYEGEDSEWYANRTLFVTGPHASGKSAVAAEALVQDGFALFDTGPILRGYHQSERPSVRFGQWVEENEIDFGETFTDELLAHHIGASVAPSDVCHPSGIVIVGNRSYGGVRHLTHRLCPPEARLVYVDASTELLYQRYRQREGRFDITPSEFEEILDIDRKLGFDELIERADLVITNEGTLNEAASRLKSYVQEWKPASS